ncbi:hypothetical protein [Halogeometricum borinquense]|uniref:hypothetical protein n=1 Tax=Halogeometricum borinquense TaxID=60847 RepID=UPI003860311A
MSSGLEQQLIDLLTVFLIAGGVGALLAKIGRVPYTIALLLAGFVASIAGLEIDITLTHDIILLVVLLPLLVGILKITYSNRGVGLAIESGLGHRVSASSPRSSFGESALNFR